MKRCQKNLLVLPLLMGLCLVLLGCASEENRSDFSRMALGDTGFDQAWVGAEKVMRHRFGKLELDRQAGLIESLSVISSPPGPTLTEARYRRRVRLMLLTHRRHWYAYVQAHHERSDQGAYRNFQYLRSGQDQWAPTPMETQQYASPARKQVWTRIKRDCELEKKILTKIRDELAIDSPRDPEVSPDG